MKFKKTYKIILSLFPSPHPVAFSLLLLPSSCSSPQHHPPLLCARLFLCNRVCLFVTVQHALWPLMDPVSGENCHRVCCLYPGQVCTCLCVCVWFPVDCVQKKTFSIKPLQTWFDI